MSDPWTGSYWRRAASERLTRRRALSLGAAASGVVALGLAGCSSSNNNKSSNANTSAPASATSGAIASATSAATSAPGSGSPSGSWSGSSARRSRPR